MKTQYDHLSCTSFLAATTRVTLTFLLATLPLQAYGANLITNRNALKGNDFLDWSSLGVLDPNNPFDFIFLENSFSAMSQGGLEVEVEIPLIPIVPPSPPLVFQTRAEGILTNYAEGDFVLFTGFNNPGPLTLSFNTPVFGAGTQVTVDDVFEFNIFQDVFDTNDSLIGSFQVPGTSSLELDNSAQFVGAISATANISKLVYRSDAGNFALGVNALSLVTLSASVPESSPLFGLGGVVVWGVVLQIKRPRKPR